MKPLAGVIILLALTLGGCAGTDHYHWGDYEQSLYQYNKNPTAENAARHKMQLTALITEAQDYNKPVPPGIYFELGMLEAQSNNTALAIKYLNQEKSAFPESTTLVNSILESPAFKNSALVNSAW